MKAVVLKSNETLVYEEIATPPVEAGTVRIHIAVCGICGSDIPRVFNGTAHHYPMVLGHEFAGTVDAIGDGVVGLEIGDHVTAAPLLPCYQCPDCLSGNYSLCNHYSFIGSRQQGAMAEYVVVPAKNIIKLPKEIPFEQAATIEPSTVALHALRHIKFTAGKRVVVIGCGIIGLYAVQWARLLGAASVTAIDRDDIGLKAAKELDADICINTQTCEKAELLQKIDPQGYDYVIECAGATQTLQMTLDLVAKKGTICLIGTPKKDLTFSVSLWEKINRKECWITGSWMSYSAPFPGEEWTASVSYMEKGLLKLVPGMVYGAFPIETAAKAFRDILAGTNGRSLLFNERQCKNEESSM